MSEFILASYRLNAKAWWSEAQSPALLARAGVGSGAHKVVVFLNALQLKQDVFLINEEGSKYSVIIRTMK
ncbi:hypothetical protein H920_11757 [Fukomys damarensis]|uniref:Uncharacterized protein n=1 Tax=Fukomys damarensis TaxID=885580 RepID=A0A091D712_FUKDA|nr:hypothetical protein H920_11757 [Fukomys damarensis]